MAKKKAYPLVIPLAIFLFFPSPFYHVVFKPPSSLPPCFLPLQSITSSFLTPSKYGRCNGLFNAHMLKCRLKGISLTKKGTTFHHPTIYCRTKKVTIFYIHPLLYDCRSSLNRSPELVLRFNSYSSSMRAHLSRPSRVMPLRPCWGPSQSKTTGPSM